MLISEQIPQKFLVTKTNLENSRNSWLHYYLAYFPIWSFMIISIYSSIFPFHSLQLSTIAYGTIEICQRWRSMLENKIMDKTEMLSAFVVMMCYCVMCLRNYDSHMSASIDSKTQDPFWRIKNSWSPMGEDRLSVWMLDTEAGRGLTCGPNSSHHLALAAIIEHS